MQKVHTKLGGSDVVRELSREPAMFQDWIVGRGTEKDKKKKQFCNLSIPNGSYGIAASAFKALRINCHYITLVL